MIRRISVIAALSVATLMLSATSAGAATQTGNHYCNPTNGYGWVDGSHKGSAEQRPPGGQNKLLGYTSSFKYYKTYDGDPGGGYWRAYGSIGLQSVDTGCIGA